MSAEIRPLYINAVHRLERAALAYLAFRWAGESVAATAALLGVSRQTVLDDLAEVAAFLRHEPCAWSRVIADQVESLRHNPARPTLRKRPGEADPTC